MPFFFYIPTDYYYYLLVIPALIFALWAQANVKSTFHKYSGVYLPQGCTGAQAAEAILHRNGIYDVRIEPVAGTLSDHYSPKEKVVRLSADVYGAASAAAVGVAAHEVGHAIQHATGYAPLKVRNAIIPVTSIASKLSIPFVILGVVLNFAPLVSAGIIFFGLATVFQLITLPVEFNASARAVAALPDVLRLDDRQLADVKKVLRAAALTYVASLAVSLASFLRILLLFTRRNSR